MFRLQCVQDTCCRVENWEEVICALGVGSKRSERWLVKFRVWAPEAPARVLLWTIVMSFPVAFGEVVRFTWHSLFTT